METTNKREMARLYLDKTKRLGELTYEGLLLRKNGLVSAADEKQVSIYELETEVDTLLQHLSASDWEADRIRTRFVKQISFYLDEIRRIRNSDKFPDLLDEDCQLFIFLLDHIRSLIFDDGISVTKLYGSAASWNFEIFSDFLTERNSFFKQNHFRSYKDAIIAYREFSKELLKLRKDIKRDISYQ